MKSDGTIAAWGDNSFGQRTVPTAQLNSSTNRVVAIAAGFAHNLALRTNGTVVVWGRNEVGQTNMPSNISNVVAIAAGAFHSIAMVGDGTPTTAPSANPNFSPGTFSFSIPSQSGRIFELNYKNSLADTNWMTTLPLVAGNGTNLILSDTNATNFQRFYRVRRW